MAARHHVCLSILIAGSVVACTAGSNVHSAPMPRALLVAADPAADADSALASADTSFTAVSGYSLRLPGVPSVLHETLLRHYGARLLANCWDILDLYLGNRAPGAPPAVPDNGGGGTQEEEAPWTPDARELRVYAGAYYSPELETALRFEIENDRLTPRQIRWGGGLGFTPVRPDEFRADAEISRARFIRDDGRITGVEIDVRRARGMWFERLAEGR